MMSCAVVFKNKVLRRNILTEEARRDRAMQKVA
jgi:hypothetical protein